MIVRAIVILALMLSGAAQAVQAQGFTPEMMEEALKHRRTAAGYLRTGNADIASLSADALQAVLQRAGKAGWGAALEKAMEAGDAMAAHEAVEALSLLLAGERRARNMPHFADCILAFSQVYEGVDVHRRAISGKPDVPLAEPPAILPAIEVSLKQLALCDSEAPAATRSGPEFRRLVDGARMSLEGLRPAIIARDREKSYRYLIELRSFERLLAFRFG